MSGKRLAGNKSTNDRLTLDCQLRMDAICDSFEDAWRQVIEGKAGAVPPDLVAFSRAPGNRDKDSRCDFEALLQELLLLEISYRTKLGDTPVLAEYQRRYHDLADTLDRLWQSATQQSATQQSATQHSATQHSATQHSATHPASPSADSRELVRIDEPEGRQTESNSDAPEDRYEIRVRVGDGGFGSVFLARDTKLQRTVALKLPHLHRFLTAGDVTLFLAEAQIAASLDHPNIVPVYDFGTMSDGRCYVVSKWIEGQTLHDLASRESLTFIRSAEIVATLAAALHHAHERGIVHRDVKPSNVLIDKAGEPHLTDFGMAAYAQSKGVGGTPGYMSPEQRGGDPQQIDSRSDVYSLGALFCELLCGDRFPAERSERSAAMLRDVPAELSRICQTATAEMKGERYQSALDFERDLLAFLATTRPGNRSDVWRSADVSVLHKGLRAFDQDDADYFLKLLPGPFDRNGLPEGIRFWRRRIESRDADRSFRVGVIYGPSGCGKSSLLRAGILSRVRDTTHVVYVEASRDSTERDLLDMLANNFQLACRTSLVEACEEARDHVGQNDKKVTVVIDQFEQYLQQDSRGLVEAIRLSDACRLQFLLVVRDDFWLELSRLFRELRIPISDRHNCWFVDLFDADHAKKVLLQFGQALGRLPPDDEMESHHEFLDRAIRELADKNGRVVSVKIALFVEMMKSLPWTPTALREMGGADGIGYQFLERTFSNRSSRAEFRHHQATVRAILTALLPQRKERDIKGQRRTFDELLVAAGCEDRPDEFQEVLDRMDRDVRLIVSTGGTPSDATHSHPAQRAYQLAHDFLVNPTRQWLLMKQRQSKRGRAQLVLEERAALWSVKPENKYLPTLFESVRIRAIAPRREWNETHRSMMEAATKCHVRRLAIQLILVAVACLAAGRFFEHRRMLAAQAEVRRLIAADVSQISRIIPEIVGRKKWSTQLLQDAYGQHGELSREKLNADIGLLYLDAGSGAEVGRALLRSTSEDFTFLRKLILDAEASVQDVMLNAMATPHSSSGERLRAACMLASTYPQAKVEWASHAEELVETLAELPARETDAWCDWLMSVDQIWAPLVRNYTNEQRDARTRINALETLLKLSQEGTASRAAELVCVAGRQDFCRVFDEVANVTGLRASLRARLDSSSMMDEAASVERHAQARVNAICGLARLQNWDLAAAALLASDVDTQSLFVHLAAEYRLLAGDVVARIKKSSDDRETQLLLLSLGQHPHTTLDDVQDAVATVSQLYSTHPDAGIHAASRWLLQTHAPRVLLRLEAELGGNGDRENVQRDWHVNRIGQTLNTLTAATIRVGAPAEERGRFPQERAQVREINRRFQMSAAEMSAAEFRKLVELVKENGNAPPALVDCLQSVNLYDPGDEYPVTVFNWFQAAATCNALSLVHGISRDQWCYEPSDDGTYGERTRPAYRMLELAGYRMPTEWEWEFACRAGTETSRFFGDSKRLMDQYVWYEANSYDEQENGRFLRPTCRLKPNPVGLFDMLGNAYEWTNSPYLDQEDLSKPISDAVDMIRGEVLRDTEIAIRGGAYWDSYFAIRSARRGACAAAAQNANVSLRVARTVTATASD